MDAKQLLAEALRLSGAERAALAGELIQSLETEVDADAEAAWSVRFARGSIDSTPAPRRQFPGLKRVVASTRQPAVTRELEYLEEALDEVEAAARWYAERSATAAVAFGEEIDAAESAILRLPEAWPGFDHGTRRYLLHRFTQYHE